MIISTVAERVAFLSRGNCRLYVTNTSEEAGTWSSALNIQYQSASKQPVSPIYTFSSSILRTLTSNEDNVPDQAAEFIEEL